MTSAVPSVRDGYATDINQAVRRHAKARPHDLAVLSDQCLLTWSDLDRRADTLTYALRHAGLQPGDHIAWLGRNRFEFVILALAARRARLIIVSLNWRLSPAETATIISDCEPKLVLLESEFASLVAGVMSDPNDPRLVYLDAGSGKQSFTDLMARGAETLPPLTPKWNEPLVLYYTSGTTGKTKGVLQGRFQADDAAWRHGVHFGWDATSVTLIVAPVFHLTGASWVHSSLYLGARQVVSAATSAALILSAIQRWSVTHTVLVPTMIHMVMNEMIASGQTVDTLRVITYGGAPMPVALLREALVRFPNCRFVQGYGLTETNSPVTFLAPEDHALEGPKSKLNSVGRDYLEIKVRVFNTEAGVPCKPGEIGEVQINSPWIMLGYRNQPELTAAAFTKDGWFRTGDGAYMDAEGYLFLADRINDMIITGGENVMPSEVENVLIQHPAVSEAAVFAIMDPTWGETICAGVVAKPGATATPDALIAFTRERLAHYKCPRRVEFIAAMPRNAMGKILRRELRVRFNPPQT